MIKLFSNLDLETISTCNRTCPTCLRNSHPDREKVSSWFQPTYLSMKTIRKALEQCADLEFAGEVCLSHYNEPLMDGRLPEIAKLSRYYFPTYCHTNGDLLTPEMAAQLDGKLDRIVVSLYQTEDVKMKRAEWVLSLFNKTVPVVNTATDHVITHYSPDPKLQSKIEQNIDCTCAEPRLHCIINHKGDFLLCCDDLVGNFSLGKFPETSISDYWFGDKHMNIYHSLEQPGGRKLFPYCSICPRD